MDDFINRFGRKKLFWISFSLLAAIVIALIIAAMVLNSGSPQDDGLFIGVYISYFIFCPALLLLGCLLFFFPERAWDLQISMSARKDEPTDFAFTTYRIGGSVLVSFVFWLIFTYLF